MDRDFLEELGWAVVEGELFGGRKGWWVIDPSANRKSITAEDEAACYQSWEMRSIVIRYYEKIQALDRAVSVLGLFLRGG